MSRGVREACSEQKVSIYGALSGRTRRIRTADLYHVKADWPHQDTRGQIKTIIESRNGQAPAALYVSHLFT